MSTALSRIPYTLWQNEVLTKSESKIELNARDDYGLTLLKKLAKMDHFGHFYEI